MKEKKYKITKWIASLYGKVSGLSVSKCMVTGGSVRRTKECNALIAEIRGMPFLGEAGYLVTEEERYTAMRLASGVYIRLAYASRHGRAVISLCNALEKLTVHQVPQEGDCLLILDATTILTSVVSIAELEDALRRAKAYIADNNIDPAAGMTLVLTEEEGSVKTRLHVYPEAYVEEL